MKPHRPNLPSRRPQLGPIIAISPFQSASDRAITKKSETFFGFVHKVTGFGYLYRVEAKNLKNFSPVLPK
jgi:hypothetical protein